MGRFDGGTCGWNVLGGRYGIIAALLPVVDAMYRDGFQSPCLFLRLVFSPGKAHLHVVCDFLVFACYANVMIFVRILPYTLKYCILNALPRSAALLPYSKAIYFLLRFLIFVLVLYAAPITVRGGGGEGVSW